MEETRRRSAPFLKPDTPMWRSELSVRENSYRYLEHQGGRIGMLRLRLIEGRNLDQTGPSEVRGRAISPQLVIKMYDEEGRSTIAQRNRHPSWKERFMFEVRKGSIPEGGPALVLFELLDTATWSNVVGKNKPRASASLDITALLNGSHGSHVMDEWVRLNPGDGSVHVVVEYEPYGMEPVVDDVVFFESFARSPRSLVFPVNEPMVVRAMSGAYLLVSFRSQGNHDNGKHYSREVRVKVHRNTVFVIERETYMDAAWHYVLDVRDVVADTTPVKLARKQLDPYMKYILAISSPALTTLSVAYGAAKLAARSSLAAMSGATTTFLGIEDAKYSNHH